MKWSKLKKFVPLLLIIFFISGYWTLPLIYYIDSKHPIHLPPMECDELSYGEVYCFKKYFDDGLVRFSIAKTEEQNCCVFERFNIQDNRINYRVKACDPISNQMLRCGIFQSDISSTKLPNVDLVEDYSVRWRFTVDDRVLISRPNWIGHLPVGER